MKLGFIGCGNMANAMINGIVASQVVKPDEIIASNRSMPALEKAQAAYGIHVTQNNNEAAEADIVFLCVKPKVYPEVIKQIRDQMTDDQIIVTIAPGFTLEALENAFGKPVKLVRTMPNTPAMVSEGMTAFTTNELVSRAETEQVKKLLNAFGRCEEVEEFMMDAVTSVSGSSPAYVYMMIEAMADGAVRDGMPRAQAVRFAAQAVLGSAKMVLETGRHPGELKDMVCSPAGTTIEAVAVLEEKGFRAAVLDAMAACTKKAKGK
ncbi:pyrroline-5-carboxylate reductase [Catenisphaera adipataccumulans]|uniref:Pyrroline-5-carboxylate reductase n=1 Tax=Catenisphaera adipataccumulans TaxID=700500 RepID=A0A7W8CXR4_9FIRM|nr:pyrroline-5-carboxylate reductase [Catenisphaera adipataccumulans]MBB5183553.1 pyrroline-5-carboxylate reductase [Catenisphaera adipataccumulans]